MERRLDRWLDRAVNVAVLGILAFALLRPDGWIGSKIVERREHGVRERIVREAIGRSALSTSVIVEFLDYQCPFCEQAEDSMRVAQERGGFTVQYRHLPLTGIHPKAEAAALVAICAEFQGAFSDVHHLLFSTDSWVDYDSIGQCPPLAQSIPNLSSFLDCLAGDEARARLAGDVALADSLGVRGTPTFVSVLGIESGLPTVEGILRLVEVER